MEEKKATQVKCQSCNESKKIKNTQRFVLIFGAVMLFFSIYGVVSLIKDLISYF